MNKGTTPDALTSQYVYGNIRKIPKALRKSVTLWRQPIYIPCQKADPGDNSGLLCSLPWDKSNHFNFLKNCNHHFCLHSIKQYFCLCEKMNRLQNKYMTRMTYTSSLFQNVSFHIMPKRTVFV